MVAVRHSQFPASPSVRRPRPAAAPAVKRERPLVVRGSLAVVRGYDPRDLRAVAEIGYHYLFAGRLDFALTLFEGLAAVAPDDPYYWLALGLARDQGGDKEGAEKCYERASRLDPKDGRADINRAELCLERGERKQALEFLRRGAAKSRAAGDGALSGKAEAIIKHLTREISR